MRHSRSVAALTLLFAAAGATHAASERSAEDHHAKMWSKLDADGDGAISREEYVERISKHFDRADANSDGKISKEEWAARKEAMRARMNEKHTHE